MLDLHPPASGLPFASVILLCISELLRRIRRFHATGETLRTAAVTSCVLSVAIAFISGYQASSRATMLAAEVENAVAWHHSLGKALLVSTLLLATFYYLSRVARHGKAAFCWLYYLALLLQVVGTIWVSSLGGQLVFTHAVNVEKE
jgi:uncharacterized membrane protein